MYVLLGKYAWLKEFNLVAMGILMGFSMQKKNLLWHNIVQQVN